MANARYDEVADSYVPADDDLQRPVTTALFDLAAPVPGEAALDLACGDGLVARELARRGLPVTGLAVSPRLLDRARSRGERVRYLQADAAHFEPTAGSFDLVTCHFGLSDIDDLPSTLANVALALTSGGRFVWSILHPCFAGGDGADPAWPPDDGYHAEGRWFATGSASTLRQRVGANHRTISTYLNALRTAGLRIDRVVEPPAEPAWSETRPGSALQPVYLVVRALGPDASAPVTGPG